MPEEHTLNLSEITPDCIDRVIAFIPRLEALDPSHISDWGDIGKTEGREVVIRLEPDYDPVVKEFMHTLYENNFVHPFDWGSWSGEAERLHKDSDLLSHADLETCVKLLTLHVRKDRFVGGHFGEMVRSGNICEILRRLHELRGL